MDNIQNADLLTTEKLLTIQILNKFNIQIPTVNLKFPLIVKGTAKLKLTGCVTRQLETRVSRGR